MEQNVPVSRQNLTDLDMYQCGTHECEHGHSYGPAVRDHFLIHYVLDGKGIFQVGDKTYQLGKDQGFLICPGIVTYYQADYKDPWTYSWVGFHGLKAESYLKQADLTQNNPIFTFDSDGFIKQCFDNMLETKKLTKSRELRLLSYLYMFISHLIETNGHGKLFHTENEKREQYVKQAVKYIEMNYSRKISIKEIAHYIGLDRSYLGSIFKDYLNASPQEFLINFRINKAAELIAGAQLSIGDIARSVGYDDPLMFSKMFRKIKGACPRDYRKQLVSNG